MSVSRYLGKEENDRRWLLLRAKLSEERLKAAFALFRQNGIEPVLIKGWAAAREYPEKQERVFSDIDLCVAPEDFEKSRKIIASEVGGKLNIDLHCGLRHLDTVEWTKLFQNSEIVDLDGERIRILRAEDHLRVLCVHWLTDGGAYKEKLLDIFYLLRNNAGKFDWDYCLGAVDENRRDWIVKTVGIVHEFYELDISQMPFAEESYKIPDWFVRELEREWESGTKLLDILVVLKNSTELRKQIRKRLRPNAIQATVMMEGRFDESSRLYYQFGSFFLRLKPLLKKTLIILKTNSQKNKRDK